MMAARSGRSVITDILLEGGVIDLDIQENVRSWYSQLSHNTSLHSTCIITQHGLPARIVLSLLILIVYRQLTMPNNTMYTEARDLGGRRCTS